VFPGLKPLLDVLRERADAVFSQALAALGCHPSAGLAAAGPSADPFAGSDDLNGELGGLGSEAPLPTEAVLYVVEPGDSLFAIANLFFGDGAFYPVLFDSNRDLIADADLIFAGQVLRVPR
jgi:nucleoid-associated protein YgaU